MPVPLCVCVYAVVRNTQYTPRKYACMHACMHACMYVCMCVCMHACMHACIAYVCITQTLNPITLASASPKMRVGMMYDTVPLSLPSPSMSKVQYTPNPVLNNPTAIYIYI